jgi:hypothetical protein
MILTAKSCYFPKQHKAFVTFNGDHKCLLWGTRRICVYYSGEIRVAGTSHGSVGYSPASHRGGPGFNSSSVDVRFVVDKVALWRVFFPSMPVFPCHYHFTSSSNSYASTRCCYQKYYPPPPPHTKRNLKYTDFVDTMISKVEHYLRFSLNQPLKSADI